MWFESTRHENKTGGRGYLLKKPPISFVMRPRTVIKNNNLLERTYGRKTFMVYPFDNMMS